MTTDSMPTSWQALDLFDTYRRDGASSPTRITVSFGGAPCFAASSDALIRSASRIRRACCFPSMIFAPELWTLFNSAFIICTNIPYGYPCGGNSGANRPQSGDGDHRHCRRKHDVPRRCVQRSTGTLGGPCEEHGREAAEYGEGPVVNQGGSGRAYAGWKDLRQRRGGDTHEARDENAHDALNDDERR